MAVDGTYDITVYTPRGEKNDRIVIKEEGNKLTGRYSGPEMGELPIDGTVSGNEVAWTLRVTLDSGQEMRIPFRLNIDGDTVTGKLSMEGDTPFDVKGKRVS